jgi:hypothetical protein
LLGRIIVKFRFLGLAFVVFVIGCEDTVEERTTEYCDDPGRAIRINAHLVAQGFVKQHLKSPQTTKFPSYLTGDVIVVSVPECSFRIDAYVDSENSFGALIRTDYSILVQYDPHKRSWAFKEIEFGE